MTATAITAAGGFTAFLSNAWAVFVLFTIPVGGGIPAGVVLAQKKGIGWPMMLVLYVVSDLALALVFEPLMHLMIRGGKRVPVLARMNEVLRTYMKKTTSQYGIHMGPLALIGIAFGVDPMTGRAAAYAAGHGFVTGWALAITGDTLFFALIMASTIWLNGILGDGTWTTIIMTAAMIFLPGRIQKWYGKLRERFKSRQSLAGR